LIEIRDGRRDVRSQVMRQSAPDGKR